MNNTAQIEQVTVRVLHHGEEKEHRLEFSSAVLLLDVLLTGAETAGVHLLPPKAVPLDRLLSIHEGKIGPAIDNLDEPLHKYLEREGASHHFAIELLDVFAVNNRWAVAKHADLPPREILALVGLSYEQYTLYPPHSDQYLPLDTPVKVCRGEKFERKRTVAMETNERTLPAGIEGDVKSLAAQGKSIKLVDHAGQCLVMVTELETPCPPWGASSHDILIAVPMAFETAGLDAFYLRQPYSFNKGTHPRVSGQTIQLEGATWQLVSWHYATDKTWMAGQDSLASHIEHCRGFFLNRKAINAI